MKHWMFRCSDVSQLVSRSMDSPLPLYRRMGVRVHLMVCRYCRLFRRQLLAIRRLSRDASGVPPEGQSPKKLSDGARARMKESLRSAS
jgi:hypothetical protein